MVGGYTPARRTDGRGALSLPSSSPPPPPSLPPHRAGPSRSAPLSRTRQTSEVAGVAGRLENHRGSQGPAEGVGIA